jgi:hypothetical protein
MANIRRIVRSETIMSNRDLLSPDRHVEAAARCRLARRSTWRMTISTSKFVAGILLLVLSLALPTTALHGSHSAGGSHSRSSSHARTSKGSHHSRRATSSSVKRDKHGRIKRSSAAKHAFEKRHPCPSTGRTSGRCPGYVVDHIKALECGGADAPSNMQWQTVAAGKAKDRTEGCR